MIKIFADFLKIDEEDNYKEITIKINDENLKSPKVKLINMLMYMDKIIVDLNDEDLKLLSEKKINCFMPTKSLKGNRQINIKAIKSDLEYKNNVNKEEPELSSLKFNVDNADNLEFLGSGKDLTKILNHIESFKRHNEYTFAELIIFNQKIEIELKVVNINDYIELRFYNQALKHYLRTVNQDSTLNKSLNFLYGDNIDKQKIFSDLDLNSTTNIQIQFVGLESLTLNKEGEKAEYTFTYRKTKITLIFDKSEENFQLSLPPVKIIK